MNKKILLSKGWIRSQSVQKFNNGQDVLIENDGSKVIGKISGVNELADPDMLMVIINSDRMLAVNKNDLLRLIVTDGERIVPLQNEDWQEAIDKGLIDSGIQLDYFVIERKSKSGPSIIRLGRIYKPNEKERKIAEAAYAAGYHDRMFNDNNRTFDDYWKEVNQQLELAD